MSSRMGAVGILIYRILTNLPPCQSETLTFAD